MVVQTSDDRPTSSAYPEVPVPERRVTVAIAEGLHARP
ncbi:MAG: hypothetical protein JWP95_2080, partial [Actinotalea sp.]|nr:hypothetical protein [Actinotalea sp.]